VVAPVLAQRSHVGDDIGIHAGNGDRPRIGIRTDILIRAERESRIRRHRCIGPAVGP